MDIDQETKTWLLRPEFEGLFRAAREAMESPTQPPTFRLELPDEQTRTAIGELYGRPLWGQGTRLSVAKLDAALRDGAAGRGLSEVLEIVHGHAVGAAQPTPEPTGEDMITRALTEHGLTDQSWAPTWTDWVHRFGRVATDELPELARQAASVLSTLNLDPQRTPTFWRSRAAVAQNDAGGPHRLDHGQPLPRLVLRAAAIAHGISPPGSESEHRFLWERCGVVDNELETSVLCWALPVLGEDSWQRVLRTRTELGLPAHLTHADLRVAPQRLVAEGTEIVICENSRVLETVLGQGLGTPMICTSGSPNTVTVELLHRLSGDGARLRYHGDFDWPGLSIAAKILRFPNAEPLRMSTVDYREAVDFAAAHRIDLPVLVGDRVDAPWDTGLADLMGTVGKSVSEEIVLPQLLSELRGTDQNP